MKLYLLAALLIAPCCQAFQASCPDSAEQALDDWTRWQGERSPADELTPVVAASRIELFAGHPAAGGTLVADDFAEAIGVAPLQWSFTAESAQAPLHMVCSYHASATRQVRQLPAGLRSCQASNEFEDAHLQLDCQ
jgi:hypothetical protein